MVEQLKEEGLPVFESKLSSSIRIRESHERNLPIIHLDRNHKLSEEYLALYRELQGACGPAARPRLLYVSYRTYIPGNFV